MATHSSILAWEIPWEEKPDWLRSPWGHEESDTIEQTCVCVMIEGKVRWAKGSEKSHLRIDSVPFLLDSCFLLQLR